MPREPRLLSGAPSHRWPPTTEILRFQLLHLNLSKPSLWGRGRRYHWCMTPGTTYGKFMDAVREKHDLMAGEWRFGQTYFNVLHETAPAIAARIVGGPYDPFSLDRVPTMTHMYVMELWYGQRND